MQEATTSPSQMELPLRLAHTRQPDAIDLYGTYFVRPGKRPNGREIVIAEAAARRVLPEVRRWLGKDDDGEGVLADLMRVAGQCEDGATAAAELKVRGWDIDMSLAETLDGMTLLVHTYRARLVAIWVRETGVVVPFAIGDGVVCKPTWQKQAVNGEITSIDRDHATCCVFCPSEGHVREGIGTHGYIFPAEELAPVRLKEFA